MTEQYFAIFDTRDRRLRDRLGSPRHHRHAIADGERGEDPQPDHQRNADLTEAAPPAKVQNAIDGMIELLAGKPNDLADIALDLDGVPAFNRGVYDIARKIPPGKTLTYGDIAKQLGGVELSRDVGQALGRNPCPIVVPCHRVLAAGNKPGGFSANGGVVTKLKMLEIEGAPVNYTPSLFD